MDYQLIRAYCAKDLNGILQPRDKWHSTPESRWDELEHRILFKHRTGARYLEPRQYAAAVCLRALEILDVPFQTDDDYPGFTEADSIETGRLMVANALNDYMPHLSVSEAAPLLPVNAELQQFKLTVTPQQVARATDTATPAPVVAANAKRRSWWDVSSPYIVEIMQAGQYATAKELYNALEAKAGSDSPFDKGTGNNRFGLFIRELATPLALKTVQNNWQKLLNAAAQY